MRIQNFYRNILCFFLLLFLFLYCSTPVLAYDSNYVWSVMDDAILTSSNTAQEVKTGNFLNLEAGSAILIEQNSGKILYEHNIHEKLRPASVTKVMTLLLIMEALDSR